MEAVQASEASRACHTCPARYHQNCYEMLLKCAVESRTDLKCCCCRMVWLASITFARKRSCEYNGEEDAIKKWKHADSTASGFVSDAENLLKVAIIGTAGRDRSRTGLTAALYRKMMDRAVLLIKDFGGGKPVQLSSGGAAWADHVAVSLFLADRTSYPFLTLHLPCRLTIQNSTHMFVDTGVGDFRVNPGRSANRYHKHFSNITSRDSIGDIFHATDQGAKTEIHNEFFERNTRVAKCDFLIAFTWATGDRPVDGGTEDTWSKCHARKVHVPMGELEKCK